MNRDPESAAAITILMPIRAYHERYLREALDSLIRQTSERWRLLIITEPARNQRLERVLGPYLRDPRIELIANQGRKLAGKFNTGMRHASTEFVAILHGDDMWAPEAVAVLTDRIRAGPEVDFFHSSRMFIDEDGEPLSSVYQGRVEVRLEDFGMPSPVKHLLCWRRLKALSFGGMDERLNSVGPDDFDFPWLMAEQGATFRAVPECLYLARDHVSSFRLTTHLPRSVHVREIRRIMRKHGVDPATIDQAVLEARGTSLRQCLYRSSLDRWFKLTLGLTSSSRWREPFV